MGGFTRMMRHLGSAMGSSGAPAFRGVWVDLVFIEVGCFGLASLAATAAHDLVDSFIGVAIVVGSWLIACVSCASFVSKTLILFVRYTFISAIYAMVISFSFPVSVFSFKAEILLYHAAYSSFSHGFSSFICSSSHTMYSMVFFICIIRSVFICSNYGSDSCSASISWVCISSSRSSSSSSRLKQLWRFGSVCCVDGFPPTSGRSSSFHLLYVSLLGSVCCVSVW